MWLLGLGIFYTVLGVTGYLISKKHEWWGVLLWVFFAFFFTFGGAWMKEDWKSALKYFLILLSTFFLAYIIDRVTH